MHMELIDTGLRITFFGLGLVFLLLALLWALMAALLRLDRPPAAQEQREPAVEQPAAQAASASTELEPEKLAAITIAVLTHRAVRRKQAAPAMRSHWPGTLLDASRWVAAGRTRQNRAWQSRQG
jgi:sodium pump decarboxylase gamma subunit